MPHLLCFTNCQICVAGELIPQDVYFSPDQAIIVPNYYYRTEGVERIDLGGAVVAPGFLELQTNGLQGLHFTQLGGKDDEERLLQVARSQVRCGVTGFWGTVPTMEEGSWKKVRFCFSFVDSASRGLPCILCHCYWRCNDRERSPNFTQQRIGGIFWNS
jgi:N-acetylglucosamine-6-phosphate deacetylase